MWGGRAHGGGAQLLGDASRVCQRGPSGRRADGPAAALAGSLRRHAAQGAGRGGTTRPRLSESAPGRRHVRAGTAPRPCRDCATSAPGMRHVPKVFRLSYGALTGIVAWDPESPPSRRSQCSHAACRHADMLLRTCVCVACSVMLQQPTLHPYRTTRARGTRAQTFRFTLPSRPRLRPAAHTSCRLLGEICRQPTRQTAHCSPHFGRSPSD